MHVFLPVLNRDSLQQLAKHECRDATHITGTFPLVLARAQGSTLWDCDGREYIDLCASFGSLPRGHNHIALRAACADNDSINTGMGDLYASEAKVALLSKLHEIMPAYLRRSALALTGSQAVEMALKTALLYQRGRSGFIALHAGYHGLDLGALSFTAMAKFRQPFSSWLHADKVEHVSLGCALTDLEQAVQRQRHLGTAALILEPVQGRGGVYACSDVWLVQVRDFCRQHGILLIFDEVFTGLGRIGTLTKAFTVECDLLCLGKALGGGMPLSALLGREEVMQAWPRNEGEALHTGTFFGHPLSCRVATATLNSIVADNLCTRAQQLGNTAHTRLRAALANCATVQEVRGAGLMLAVVFRQAQQGVYFARALAEQGIIAIPAGTQGECLSITPALNIPEDMLFAALDKIAAVFLSSADADDGMDDSLFFC